MQLDHVTIRTGDLEATKLFLIGVFDLVEKERPKMIQHIPGFWLFDGNDPIIHVIKSFGNHLDHASETIDHVGFKLENYTAFKKKLERLKIPYSLMDIEELNERRIFFRTPTGVLLEGVFNESV
ncbi:hypothetical protein SGQ83_20300 [Flavobacterium sp. Fl-318]|jgi:glyoxylase I family protein|uniref:VOC domain-containing protein n=1 Tax=Flavobacterium cupriresistens TaxID=2893885 RepID=A0ABU4RGK0_9FLAO|nr:MULTISPECIES: VOC family protein [unclassified Flavobacterium]MDX6191708.1 hypothetical protein [Flavobacterium sp. Fl-318]UFH41652.1 hypothetical protein LNP23_17765 [Flavobacterium sp. F-323]